MHTLATTATQSYEEFVAAWNNERDGYMYSGAAPEPTGVTFHREVAEDLDPVTYEVIRHSLWGSIDEHATACMRGSGSPIVVFGQDFSPSLMTEDAEYVYVAPHVTFLGATCQAATRWTLEHRSVSPGIHEGDMFLTNDPWICGVHQQDVVVVHPVFVEGKLFAWVANTMHQYDIGGNTPGSFCAGARDVFDEGAVVPPIKIVEGGVLRTDLEEWYERQSRMPHLLGLDLRAEIAGCTVAARRVLELVERYGAGTVKAAMRRVIDDAEQVFLDRLSRLADGTYSDRGYLESGAVDSRETYRLQLNVTKKGDKLVFDNIGTDPEVGCLNSTLAGWRGGILNALMVTFCFDLQNAIGGPWRHIELRPEPGTLCTASYPSSVSNAPNFTISRTLGLGCQAISRMLVTDPAQKENIFTTPSSCGCAANLLISGVNQRGEQFGSLLLEMMSGGRGGFSFRDGMPTAGLIYQVHGEMLNVEHSEMHMPLLYLYMRELPDSGGPGKFARGNSLEVAVKLHGVEDVVVGSAAGGLAVPGTPGLYGGYPGVTNRLAWYRGSSVEAQMGAGAIPQHLTDLDGTLSAIAPISVGARWSRASGDVLQYRIQASAGYGDPLERDIALLEEDLEFAYMSQPVLEEIYGAVFIGERIDAEATLRRREELRARRLESFSEPPEQLDEEPELLDGQGEGMLVSELLEVRNASDGTAYSCCVKCGTAVAPLEANFKEFSPTLAQPITAISPIQQDPHELVDDDFEFRSFCCRGCGALLDAEIVRSDTSSLRSWLLATPERV
jgi:N-methylhydantoinase B